VSTDSGSVPGCRWSTDSTNSITNTSTKLFATAVNSPTLFTNFGTAVTGNIKAAQGTIYGCSAVNLNGAVRYLQFFNTTSTTTPVYYQILIPQSGGQVIFGSEALSVNGLNFSIGITYGFSTTSGTYTAATAAQHTIQLTYK
jgi:hypothetical protein